MRAIGYQQAHALSDTNSSNDTNSSKNTDKHPAPLTDIELPMPEVSGQDLLVEVKAISVNPVDTKIRANVSADANDWKVLGWDASGIVKAVGPDVTLFQPGDRVWYAGDLTRSGSNAEYQLVDERIVGRMPNNASFTEAAALPLTAITAWELLFDRLAVDTSNHPDKASHTENAPDTLLVIGAAGGVGSILIQLARQLTSLTIIATASRDESKQWLHQLGAHHVIDHRQSLSEQLTGLGIPEVSSVASLTHTEQHLDEIIKVLKPQGKLALIDDPQSLDIRALKSKSLSLHWEFMFTRSMYQTGDMVAQHHLLNKVAELMEEERIQSTVRSNFGSINADNLIKAHELIETSKSIGKIVLEGFN
ncbi:zinc-binding alcohol dehydrogenase family protein [Litoribrevibacter albus]|nr:zinc-binding alcohol dehydrogenase family protein [Litoribrevibacter albus]